MSTRNIPRGNGGRCVRLTTSPLSRDECYEIWEPKPPGTLWATPGLFRDSFTLHVYIKVDLQEVEWRGIDWIVLAQDKGKWRALVKAVMNLWVP
jgi:hypothetical protein